MRLFPSIVTQLSPNLLFFFFFNDTATTEIYTLSLHDALPISGRLLGGQQGHLRLFDLELQTVLHLLVLGFRRAKRALREDRKSTRLNSSHDQISYAVFCLKKKKMVHDYAVRSPNSTEVETLRL